LHHRLSSFFPAPWIARQSCLVNSAMVIGCGGVGVDLSSSSSCQSIDDSGGIKLLRCWVTPGIELGGSWLGTGAGEEESGMAVGMVVGCRSPAMTDCQLRIICSILSSVRST